MKLLTLINFLLFSSTTILFAQLPESRINEIRSEVAMVHAKEQKAFKKGDCDVVVTFFDPKVTFYANGRHIPSLEALRNLCTRITRPFETNERINTNINVLSETSAYSVRVIEFPPQEEGENRKREVVTKVWYKGEEGWKIVHFQSSISEIPN
ncbi:MAG: nuclear transport factor 2 family protein [Candidatus Cyclobacteriaceae bacterium M2_1C_046]